MKTALGITKYPKPVQCKTFLVKLWTKQYKTASNPFQQYPSDGPRGLGQHNAGHEFVKNTFNKQLKNIQELNQLLIGMIPIHWEIQLIASLSSAKITVSTPTMIIISKYLFNSQPLGPQRRLNSLHRGSYIAAFPICEQYWNIELSPFSLCSSLALFDALIPSIRAKIVTTATLMPNIMNIRFSLFIYATSGSQS